MKKTMTGLQAGQLYNKLCDKFNKNDKEYYCENCKFTWKDFGYPIRCPSCFSKEVGEGENTMECKDCVYWEKEMNWCVKRTDPTINHKIAGLSCRYWRNKINEPKK